MAIIKAYEGESINYELNNCVDLTRLSDLHNDIQDRARQLSSYEGSELLRGIYKQSLNERLEEYKNDILASDLLVLRVPHSLIAHNTNYRLLIDRFAEQDERNDDYTLYLPNSAIQSVNVLGGEQSEHQVCPNLWLKVKTGQEKPIMKISKGSLVEDDSQGRWYNFPFSLTSVTALSRTGNQIK